MNSRLSKSNFMKCFIFVFALMVAFQFTTPHSSYAKWDEDDSETKGEDISPIITVLVAAVAVFVGYRIYKSKTSYNFADTENNQTLSTKLKIRPQLSFGADGKDKVNLGLKYQF